MTTRRFLVVEDDPVVARTFCASIGRMAPAFSVSTLAEARRARPSEDWYGIVLDVRLPDGNGLRFLQELRDAGDSVPVLVVTGHFDPAIANECHRLRAHCVFKPELVVNLKQFVDEALTSSDTSAPIDAAVAHLARTFVLSRREAEIAKLVATGVPRDELAGQMGVSNNTVKTLIRSLLSKCNATSVESIARIVLEKTVELSKARGQAAS